jgi:uncharacterized protein with GYD domain
MPTYIATVKFTPQGVAAVKDTGKRAGAFKNAARKLGVKVTDIYWTLGPFDGLVIMEADNEQAITAAMLQLAAQGNVQTQTARAFDAGEIEKIVARLNK